MLNQAQNDDLCFSETSLKAAVYQSLAENIEKASALSMSKDELIDHLIECFNKTLSVVPAPATACAPANSEFDTLAGP